jgi:hypothetical protein
MSAFAVALAGKTWLVAAHMSAFDPKRTLRQFGLISSRRIGDLGQRTLPTTHVRGQDAENA